MDKNQFVKEFRQATEKVIEEMAENENINLQSFYSMTCLLENLVFFSPVLHAFIERENEKNNNKNK